MPLFDTVIMGVIVINAVVLGLETFDDLAGRYHGLFTCSTASSSASTSSSC